MPPRPLSELDDQALDEDGARGTEGLSGSFRACFQCIAITMPEHLDAVETECESMHRAANRSGSLNGG